MAEDPRDWEVETQAVRGGLARTPYGEISEALFLNQSFAYESAQAADDRFAGRSEGFIYQRFGNPTTQMFEDRLAQSQNRGAKTICHFQDHRFRGPHASIRQLHCLRAK